MSLNKSQGNMYPWVDGTRNFIRGRCPHLCRYCYMCRTWGRYAPTHPIVLVQKELKAKLGGGKRIFIGSSIDMWAEEIPEMWDLLVLAACHNYPGNEYLFQTKNSKRLHAMKNSFPLRSILGVTLESNREYPDISRAPTIADRVYWMKRLREETSLKIMISIEPIMDFDLEEFVEMIKEIRPSFVSIGADSKCHHLMEPSLEKVGELLVALRTITELKIKPNLKRLL